MSILLYESYRPGKQAFARIKDAERSLVIKLAVGRGVIVDAWAEDLEFNKITKAAVGTKLKIHVDIRNDGDDDYMWYTVKDIDAGTIIDQSIAGTFLKRGGDLHRTGKEQTMPDKTWNLLVEAGHGR